MIHMEDKIAAQLFQYGVLGVVTLVFGFVIFKLWQRLEELHAARMSDAQRHQQELSGVLKSCTEVLTVVTSSLSLQREAMVELRDSFKEVAVEIRSLHGKVGTK